MATKKKQTEQAAAEEALDAFCEQQAVEIALHSEAPVEEAPAEEPEKPKDIREVLVRLFSVPRGKRSPPALVKYRPNGSVVDAYVIVDLPGDRIEMGWAAFRNAGCGGHEEYLNMVYGITQSDVPRMYRNIEYVTLG